MADSKVSALTATTTLADTDLLYVSSSGADKKITGANVKSSVLASGVVTSTMIADGTIVNADINASAAIAGSKLNFALDDASDAAINAAAAGNTIVHDGSNFVNTSYGPKRSALQLSGSLYENIPRYLATQATATTSQRLMLTAIELPKGITVTSISFASGSTALATGVHQFFGLYDSSRARLAVSNNDTSTAWAANTVKTLAMTSPFVTTYTGLHYAALLIQATTMPTLLHYAASIATAMQAAPILGGQADSGITSLPANAASISTVFSGIWWCQVN